MRPVLYLIRDNYRSRRVLASAFVGLLTAALCTGCPPSDLEPFPDTTSDSAVTTDTVSDDVEDVSDDTQPREDVFEPSAEFEDVSAILTGTCGEAFCHGSNPNGSFHISGGTSAPPAAVRDALEAEVASGNGPFVSPNSLDDSLIHVRITSEQAPMPPEPQEPLSADDIATIRTWIENGASYE